MSHKGDTEVLVLSATNRPSAVKRAEKVLETADANLGYATEDGDACQFVYGRAYRAKLI